jgi:hypothetical protein
LLVKSTIHHLLRNVLLLLSLLVESLGPIESLLLLIANIVLVLALHLMTG